MTGRHYMIQNKDYNQKVLQLICLNSKGKTAERELTSKAILKQLNRNRNKSTMKGKTEVPHIRYVNARDKSTDLIRPEKRKKRGGKKKVRKEGYNLVEKASPKMTQLLRMGLAKKGELHTMLRAIKRGPDAMKDPKLRSKMFELLNKLVDIIEKDGQIFVKVRQNVQKNRADLQAVEEMLALEGVILGVNKSFEQLNITEDMSGMSVSSGHKRSVAQGAGMTKKGVAAYRRRNPGSKLKTAVTTPPSKLKPGSKAANRRGLFAQDPEVGQVKEVKQLEEDGIANMKNLEQTIRMVMEQQANAGVLEYGSDIARDTYAKDTPGQTPGIDHNPVQHQHKPELAMDGVPMPGGELKKPQFQKGIKDGGPVTPNNKLSEKKGECGEGEYWCNKDQKCKPIPDGMKVDKDGILVKEGKKNCGCGKDPCETYGKEEMQEAGRWDKTSTGKAYRNFHQKRKEDKLKRMN